MPVPDDPLTIESNSTARANLMVQPRPFCACHSDVMALNLPSFYCDVATVCRGADLSGPGSLELLPWPLQDKTRLHDRRCC